MSATPPIPPQDPSLARAKDRLAAAGFVGSLVGHDARNRLASVRAALELLEAGLERSLTAEHRTMLLSQFDEFVDDFNLRIDMARGDGGPAEALSARELIGAIVESFRSHAARRGIALEVHFGHARDPIRADRRLLRLAILNILRNAAEALEGAAAPRIELVTADDPERLRVDIRDNGPGVPRALAERLFREPSGGREPAAGLGLVITRDALIVMGGSVEYRPDSALGGGCFRLSLPLA